MKTSASKGAFGVEGVPTVWSVEDWKDWHDSIKACLQRIAQRARRRGGRPKGAAKP